MKTRRNILQSIPLLFAVPVVGAEKSLAIETAENSKGAATQKLREIKHAADQLNRKNPPISLYGGRILIVTPNSVGCITLWDREKIFAYAVICCDNNGKTTVLKTRSNNIYDDFKQAEEDFRVNPNRPTV